MTQPSLNTTNITLLVLPDSTMMTVASVIDPLRAANRILSQKLFDWQITSPTGKPVKFAGDFELNVDCAFEEASRSDLLIVIASFNQDRHASKNLIQTLKSKTHLYDIICGVEAGTWLLARASIITHEKITTHWEDIELLAQKFPNLDVRNNRYIIDDKIWTCGGASPALDMMLHLIEQRCNITTALNVASVFIYDQAHKAHDQQPNLSLGRLEKLEPRIAEAVRMMEQTLDQPMLVSKIATKMNLSVKMLEILFRKHLDETPGNYYLQLRLQAAQKLTLDTKLSIQEIAVQTGFNSQSNLSRSFKNRYGQSPVQMRSQINSD